MKLREETALAITLAMLGIIAIVNILPIQEILKLITYFALFITTINLWILKLRNYVPSILWTIPLASLLSHLIVYVGIFRNAWNYAYGVFYTTIALSLIYSEKSLELEIPKLGRKDVAAVTVLVLAGFFMSRIVTLEPIIFFYLLGPILEYAVSKSITPTRIISNKVVFATICAIVALSFYTEFPSLLLVAIVGLAFRTGLGGFKGIFGDYVLRLSSIISRYVI